MAARFTKTTVASPETLGARMRVLRENAHMTETALARKVGVTPKYIVALEAENVAALPNLMYARQFVLAIAKALKTPGEELIALLNQSWRLGMSERAQEPCGAFVLRPRASAFMVTPRIIRFGLGGALAVLIFSVLITRAYARLRPPELAIMAPVENTVITTPTVALQGKTAREATVMINSVQVLPDTQGYFRSLVDLKLGVNVLRISSRKPHTQEKVIYRRVVYQP